MIRIKLVIGSGIVGLYQITRSMQTVSPKSAGIALIVFTVLMIFTMTLHPAGGSFDHIVKVQSMILTTHAIAITSLPFALVGFWGLTQVLGTRSFFSITAFAMILLGIMAAMNASATNGIVLPIFARRYQGATPEVIESLKPFLKYNFTVNSAFDYIYTAAFGFAMLFCSLAILTDCKTGRKLPTWIAWLGVLLAFVSVAMLCSGIAVFTLGGFRIYISGMVLWILLVGWQFTRWRDNLL